MPAQGKSGVVVTAAVSVCASPAFAAPVNIDTSKFSPLSDAAFGCTSRAKDEAARGITDGWGQVTVAGLGSGGGGSVSYGIAQCRIGLAWPSTSRQSGNRSG